MKFSGNSLAPKVQLNETKWFLFPLLEARISFLFIKGDLTVTVVPTALLMLISFFHGDLNLGESTLRLGQGLVYFWLFIYTFCLSNQLTGIEEDRINKPHRPIPSGILSKKEAMIRYVIYSLVFLIYGCWLGVAPWAFLWVGLTVIHNFTALGKQWFMKSCLIMGAGVVAQLVAAWIIATGEIDMGTMGWILLLATWVGTCTPVQDFRDMAGDQALDRRTLPLVLGEMRSRRVMAGVFAIMAIALVGAFSVLLDFHFTVLTIICLFGLFTGNLIIGLRIVRKRTPKQDHNSYLLYTLLYCGLILSGFWAL